MLSAKDNELMCRTNADTAMGQAMRHFWIPALLSSELPEPDCDPVHVELLGGNFVAFRNSEGEVGILDEMCCHRGASLTTGRAEKCGLRCIYHGWLFAADGTVLETPNVADERFKTRFKAKSFPVKEAGGIVWTYLGEAENLPPFYDFPFIGAPAEKLLSTVQIVGCNYIQVLEGLLDSSHLSLLHISQFKQDNLADIKFVQNTGHMQHNTAPLIEAQETEFGLHYGAQRIFGDTSETNVTAFISPFFILNPNDIYMAIVPMTDEKCAFYSVWYDGERDYGLDPLRTDQLHTVGLDRLEEYGMTRKSFYTQAAGSRANGFRQDRAQVRAGHHTGMGSFVQEDALICVSAGGLRDREYEHLAPADMAIAQMYRVLLKSAKQVAAGGKPIAHQMSVASLRGGRFSVPVGTDWRTLVPGNLPQTKSVA
ncbi:Rieske 2Fe-2S domain-containing protein [Sphingobium sp.]|uniref:Rieske 2Fe-2S domain-containing protein n=1 Tax=Sphingobium sp. TaxID=1912891 RepID=UPI0028BF1AAF|nr:Rieske 2Fe-2S domain-containing protein [Sphingobium sp.]